MVQNNAEDIGVFSCPVCLANSGGAVETGLNGSVTSDGRYIGHIPLYDYCRKCGYIYRDRRDTLDFDKFYREEYTLLSGEQGMERLLYEDGGLAYAGYLVDFFADFLENSDKKKFLDIGAGKGNVVGALHARFPEIRISAVEPGKAFAVLKDNKFLDEARNSFFSSRAFNGAVFDYISLSEVLEHVFDPRSFLEDVRLIMSDDSVLLISVPNVENDKYDFLSPDHISRFTPESLENLFKVSGFRIVKTRVFQNSSSMVFIVKKGGNENIEAFDSLTVIRSALDFIDRAIADATGLKNKIVAVYGQGLVLNYLIGQKIFRAEDIACVIDDNRAYYGKKWKGAADIISFDDFLKNFHVKNIFLAMNECYQEQVVSKIPAIYDVFGSGVNIRRGRR